MPDPEEEDILFLQLPVLFKMKKKKQKKTKKWVRELFRKREEEKSIQQFSTRNETSR